MLKIKLSDRLGRVENQVMEYEGDLKAMPNFIKALAIPKLKKIISDEIPEELQQFVRVSEQTERAWNMEADEMQYQPLIGLTIDDQMPDEFLKVLQDKLVELQSWVEDELIMGTLGRLGR